ncbi:MAG: hypothetical protein HY042_12250 [Spirochaetia bacterium]|nr:hypothetical protein [Spirochaetia bacterium]
MDLAVTTDVGPRIIHCALAGQSNLFWEDPSTAGAHGNAVDDGTWRIYGGHRLWHAPESKPRTYEADNKPVPYTEVPNGVTLTPQKDEATGIRKEITLTLEPNRPCALVKHTLINLNAWPIELAAWAITVLGPDTIALIPMPDAPPGLLPSGTVSIWPYTDLSDPRFQWSKNVIRVRQGPGDAQKIGSSTRSGLCGAVRHNTLFVKKFKYLGGRYPDYESTVEVYTNADMLELETLGPLTTLLPGESVEHLEEWHLAQVSEDWEKQDMLSVMKAAAR